MLQPEKNADPILRCPPGRSEPAHRRCGGGFDIYSGLPLHAYLTSLGKKVHLANLSFARLNESGCDTIEGKAWIVDATARELDYFPERYLVEWFSRQGEEMSVIGFPKTGVMPLEAAYNAVIAKFAIDTVILIDGGTDSIIKGDEPGLGSQVLGARSWDRRGGCDIAGRRERAQRAAGNARLLGLRHRPFPWHLAPQLPGERGGADQGRRFQGLLLIDPRHAADAQFPGRGRVREHASAST